MPDRPPIRVTIIPTPYTWIALPGFTEVWQAQRRHAKGIYIWSKEHDGAYLPNYVGKTSGAGGFESRLWQEWKDWKANRYRVPVDIDRWLDGERIELTAEPPGNFEREIRTLEPLYRLFLVPLDLAEHGDRLCRHVEAVFVDTMRRNLRAFEFLCNRDRHRAYRPRAEMPGVVISADSAPIIGLEPLREPLPVSL